MGKLTDKMVGRINEMYEQSPSYTKVANELRLDWRTVKKHVKHENKLEPEEDLAPAAYRLFHAGKTPIDVATTLPLRFEDVEAFYTEYWRLIGLYQLFQLYGELGESRNLWTFVELYKLMKSKEILVTEFVDNMQDIKEIRQIRLKLEDSNEELKSLKEEKDQRTGEVQDLSQQERDIRKNISALQEKFNPLSANVRRLENIETGLKTEGAIRRAGEHAEARTKAVFSDKAILLAIALEALIRAMRMNKGRTFSLLYPEEVAQLRAIAGEHSSLPEDVKELLLIARDIFDKLLEKVVEESVNLAAREGDLHKE